MLLMPLTWQPDVPCGRRLLRRERLAVVAPGSGRTRVTAASGLRPLGDVPWLLNPDGCGFRQALMEQMAASGGRLRVRFEVDAAPSEHLALVAAGLGHSIVPISALRSASAAKVRRIDLPAARFTLGVWQLWRTPEDWHGAELVAALGEIFRTRAASV